VPGRVKIDFHAQVEIGFRLAADDSGEVKNHLRGRCDDCLKIPWSLSSTSDCQSIVKR
jgi:hypothetical protein